MAGTQGVSLRPRDAVQGGLADNVHVRWDEVRFVQWDYNGKVNPPVLALAIAMHELTDASSKFVQYYSAGDLKNLVPSSDGKRAVPVGSQAGLNNNTNAMQLIESLCNAAPGFEDQMTTDDVSLLFEGVECYMERVAQPKRTGLLNRPNQIGQVPGQSSASNPDQTVLVVKKVYKLPNGQVLAQPPADIKATGVGQQQRQSGAPQAPAGAAGTAATVGTAAAAAPLQASAPAVGSPASNGMDSEAEGVIGSIIAEANGSISRKAIAGKLFQKLASDPNRNAIVALAGNAAWLGDANRPWTMANDTLAFPS